jgi:hypothetical protein
MEQTEPTGWCPLHPILSTIPCIHSVCIHYTYALVYSASDILVTQKEVQKSNTTREQTVHTVCTYMAWNVSMRAKQQQTNPRGSCAVSLLFPKTWGPHHISAPRRKKGKERTRSIQIRSHSWLDRGSARIHSSGPLFSSFYFSHFFWSLPCNNYFGVPDLDASVGTYL